ncbi:5'-nucleotidase C-terminal domain-containing protein [Sulfitobacter sp. HNIBRBA3233]|uniref:5'-nucleotidase C-terminal domain-containing protein n=1 Tax=Sulfitobacter marinivivus TaxID=3158558 RepID=UPI0032DF6245
MADLSGTVIAIVDFNPYWYLRGMGKTPILAATSTAPDRARLRVLSTTDLHGHLLAHDYIKDRPTQGTGLASLAPLIHAARAEAAADGQIALLLDNGDTFQGTTMARHLARRPVAADHPIVAALNALEYDAVGVGNHDLDHGMDYLRAVAGELRMPVLSTNLVGANLSPLRADTMIERPLPGSPHEILRIGVVSIMPAQTAAWHGDRLGNDRMLLDPQALVRARATALRAAGADLVLLLAHLGIEDGPGAPQDNGTALAIARSGTVDAMILGHVHRRLPSADYHGWTGIDAEAGAIAGVPAVMPGHAGSDLGVMDLELRRDAEGRWCVVTHRSTLRRNPQDGPSDPTIAGLVAPVHRMLVELLSTPVGRTTKALHTYFSLAAPGPAQSLVARAMQRMVRKALGPDDDRPVIAAVAALAAGGRDGPDNFLEIPAGTVQRRHIAGLNPYANRTLGVAITGADLHRLLEHSATVFQQLTPGSCDQNLVDAALPGFQFDTVFGVTCEIDPRRPAGARITNVQYAGQPVAADQRFVLATTPFRAAGGGGYVGHAPENVVVPAIPGLEVAIADSFHPHDHNGAAEFPVPWRFAAGDTRHALLRTHPRAQAWLGDIAHLAPEPLMTDSDGFLVLRLTL